MPMHKHYIDGRFFVENGIENCEDGKVFLKREIPIRFVRDRFCNGIGRLFGPGGKTIQQLRRRSRCSVTINTDVKTQQFPGKVTITITETMDVARREVAFTVAEVLAILDENDVRNVNLSEFQLFSPEENDPNFMWHPASFKTESLKVLPGGGIDQASFAAGVVQRKASSMTEAMIEKYLHPAIPASPSALITSDSLPVQHGTYCQQMRRPLANMPLFAVSNGAPQFSHSLQPVLIQPSFLSSGNGTSGAHFHGYLQAPSNSGVGNSGPFPHWPISSCVCGCAVCGRARMN